MTEGSPLSGKGKLKGSLQVSTHHWSSHYRAHVQCYHKQCSRTPKCVRWLKWRSLRAVRGVRASSPRICSFTNVLTLVKQAPKISIIRFCSHSSGNPASRSCADSLESKRISSEEKCSFFASQEIFIHRVHDDLHTSILRPLSERKAGSVSSLGRLWISARG